MPFLKALLVSSFWAFGLGQLQQPMLLISRTADRSAHISCKVSTQNFDDEVIFWYLQKPNQGIEHILYIWKSRIGDESHKFEASKNSDTSTTDLKINFLEKGDEAMYYCAVYHLDGWIKLFGKGTRLIVIPTDKSMDGDFSPKPTIFLPSIAETTLHKAGTYLCLLENFFPDAIQVYWKEKNSDKVLESQQGNTMKIKDTYMKFSWLTVPQKSFSKEHRCIVKHETKAGGRDQEILFPAIQKAGTVSEAKGNERKPDIVGDEQPGTVLGTPDTERNATHDGYPEDVLMLQLTQTSAYYTYLLLLVKSAVYLAIVTFSMFRRTAICGVQRAPNQ